MLGTLQGVRDLAIYKVHTSPLLAHGTHNVKTQYTSLCKIS